MSRIIEDKTFIEYAVANAYNNNDYTLLTELVVIIRGFDDIVVELVEDQPFLYYSACMEVMNDLDHYELSEIRRLITKETQTNTDNHYRAKVMAEEVFDFVSSISNTFFGGTEYNDTLQAYIAPQSSNKIIEDYIYNCYSSNNTDVVLMTVWYSVEYIQINGVYTLRLHIKDDKGKVYTSILL